ncbi:MAG TPA: serine hydrolase domain-containing protein [Friedmanniella sp.]
MTAGGPGSRRARAGHDLELRTDIATRVLAAGYEPSDPLVVGVQRVDGPPELVASGRTPGGELLGAGTVVYTASLAKQVTAACAALLVQRHRLDLESTLASWVPELPGWADEVAVRHLISHTSGLPEVDRYGELERAGLDRTTAGVVGALVRHDRLDCAPGTEHRYSNAGYVCLGLVVARAAGLPLADAARDLVLAPLGLSDSRFWSGPAPRPPGAAQLHPLHPAPLSLGDGGFWSTAADLLRWNLAMDRDALGVSALVQTPGRLDDGTPLDYAWGIGVRELGGRRFYLHGGRWAGLNARLVRFAGRGSGFVLLALDDDEERLSLLTESMLDAQVG